MTDLQKALRRSMRKTYLASRKLAVKIGCTIQIEHERGEYTYWVYGPEHVYGVSGDEHGPRADPCEGDHSCACWYEVMESLRIYQRDLVCFGAGLSAEQTEELIFAGDPGLFAAWLGAPDEPTGAMVLADWLEEQNKYLGAATILRSHAENRAFVNRLRSELGCLKAITIYT